MAFDSTGLDCCYSWGNGAQRLGHKSSSIEHHPRRMDTFNGVIVQEVACGRRHNVAIVGRRVSVSTPRSQTA